MSSGRNNRARQTTAAQTTVPALRRAASATVAVTAHTASALCRPLPPCSPPSLSGIAFHQQLVLLLRHRSHRRAAESPYPARESEYEREGGREREERREGKGEAVRSLSEPRVVVEQDPPSAVAGFPIASLISARERERATTRR